MTDFDWRKAAESYKGRFQDFQDLMLQRVQDILLVASPYDSFILEEDGQLLDLILKGVAFRNTSTTAAAKARPDHEGLGAGTAAPSLLPVCGARPARGRTTSRRRRTTSRSRSSRSRTSPASRIRARRPT